MQFNTWKIVSVLFKEPKPKDATPKPSKNKAVIVKTNQETFESKPSSTSLKHNEDSADNKDSAETNNNNTKSSLRNSTAQKRKEQELRHQERAAREKIKSKRSAGATASTSSTTGVPSGNGNELFRRMTQEELLAEAKITEEINLASLGKLKSTRNILKSKCKVLMGHMRRFYFS